MQSNRPDAVRTTDRMESEGCPKIDRCNVFFHRGRTSSNEPGNRSSRNREKNPKHSWFTGSNPDAVQSTGCSPDHRPDGVRKVSGKSIGAFFFHRGRTSSNEPGNRSSRNREKNPKHSVQWIEPDAVQSTGCSPTTDRWSPEGVRKIDRCNVFFHRGRTSSNEPGNRSSRNREKNPKHSWFTGSNPDAVQSTGCSPDHRPDGVRKVSGKSIGAMFFFIGAEPRVMNQEIDQAETEKKTQNIPGSPDRTRMQSNRPDAVRTTDRMESGRCPKIENRSSNEPGNFPGSSGPTGCSPDLDGVRKIDRSNETSSNEPETEKKKNPKHSWFTGSNPDAVQSTGCSPDHRPDGVRKVSGKSIGAMFFFIGAEPRVMNQEIDRAETEKKTQNIPGSPDRTRMQSNRPDAEIDQETDRPDGVRRSVRKIDRCNVFFIGAEPRDNEPGSIEPGSIEPKPRKKHGAMFFFIGAEPRVMN